MLVQLQVDLCRLVTSCQLPRCLADAAWLSVALNILTVVGSMNDQDVLCAVQVQTGGTGIPGAPGYGDRGGYNRDRPPRGDRPPRQ